MVTTLAGSGTAAWADGVGSAASFNNPFGISVDSNGVILVADQTNNRIRKISSAGEELAYNFPIHYCSPSVFVIECL